MPAKKFRKKPVVVEAIRWDGNNIVAVTEFMQPAAPVYLNRDDIVGIQTLEGVMVARIGDWLIKGIAGELYPCKPDIFEATYERVEEVDDGR